MKGCLCTARYNRKAIETERLLNCNKVYYEQKLESLNKPIMLFRIKVLLQFIPYHECTILFLVATKTIIALVPNLCSIISEHSAFTITMHQVNVEQRQETRETFVKNTHRVRRKKKKKVIPLSQVVSTQKTRLCMLMLIV